MSLFGAIVVYIFPPYSVRMRENADQNNSKYGHFLRSAPFIDQLFRKKNFFIKNLPKHDITCRNSWIEIKPFPSLSKTLKASRNVSSGIIDRIFRSIIAKNSSNSMLSLPKKVVVLFNGVLFLLKDSFIQISKNLISYQKALITLSWLVHI